MSELPAQLEEELALVFERQLAQFSKENAALNKLATVLIERQLGRKVKLRDLQYDRESSTIFFTEEASQEETKDSAEQGNQERPAIGAGTS